MAAKDEVCCLIDQANAAMVKTQISLNLFHLYLRHGEFVEAEKCRDQACAGFEAHLDNMAAASKKVFENGGQRA